METDTTENTEIPSANPTAAESPAPEKPSGPAQMLKDGASQLTKEAGNKARTYVEDGKARAGGALDELAKLMTDAAGTVDEKVGEQYGQYARNAADAVTGFSESLKAKNVDELIGDATDFVKKSPAIAIGTAAAVGFVLVRLLQSGLTADTTAPQNDTNA
ncbi:hypothetical protein H5J25_08550 [Sphingomonas aliaeris]|uniref:Uncharacterized protein n=1 Tax=Sphingomonas aliaeris TaxID=2759526 RepID=A0A974NXD7_9SPHN|nr:hypothetical protein [Sphingomonas aliaeris]QQV78635.1 hypothetical protein H5J25_08550 [Sphingomonas aliaeris]